jgi:hypothetical protein
LTKMMRTARRAEAKWARSPLFLFAGSPGVECSNAPGRRKHIPQGFAALAPGLGNECMKGSDLVRIIDEMQHQKNIEREIIFSGIESALQLAAEKKYGEGSVVSVTIDRDTGNITAKHGDNVIDPAEFGRIAAQSAKNVMIQKIREAECSSVYTEYAGMKGDLVHGAVTRHEGGA